MRIEPFLDWPRLLGLGGLRAAEPALPMTEAEPPALPEPEDRIADDSRAPRRMSPRQLAEWAHELYVEDVMTWDEYKLAGFPSELHPSFAWTIGALTGERAEPDRPRDMIQDWELRHAFERRHHGRESPSAQRCARVLELLRWQDEGRLTPPPGRRARRG